MRRLFPALLLCSATLASLIATPTLAQERASRREAVGLIMGFKGDELESGTETNQGPWAAGRERVRSQWDRNARQGRERVARLARELGLPPGQAGEAGNARLLRFDRPLRGQALDNAVRRARLHPDVAWVEPDVLVPRLAVPVSPNDPLFPQQWHLQTPDSVNRSALNLTSAWGDTTGSTSGPTAVVAVVDSGIRPGHPDLAGRLLPGYDLVSELAVANDGDGRDPDPSDPGDWVHPGDLADPLFAGCDVSNSTWHGTFIAGQIAAATDNAQGVAGLNWGAKVLPVRVSGKCGARLSDLLDGLRWAAGLPVSGLPVNPNPARVINLSFGGDSACTPAYQTTIDAVTNAGALVVVAAGNSNTTLTRPADCRRVMAVASVRRDGAKADYSSFGTRVALAAPGGSNDAGPSTLLYSTDNSGTTTPGVDMYGYKQGTSFAAPQAAGVASLMLAVNPFLSPRQLIERMKAGVRPHATAAETGLAVSCGASGGPSCNCTTTTCGAGLLDANTSVQLATGPAVVIKPVGEVEPGTVITLDGSQSVPIPGRSIVSYQWVQVSGQPVTLSSANTAVAQATLVAEDSYVFSLTVVDNFARTGEDTVRTVAAMPAPAASGGGGGGSTGQLWGMSLWAWVMAVALWQRRRPRA
jgi:serine protease